MGFGMAYPVKLPKLGLEMEVGTVLEWHVEEGESVAEGEVLLEVESEKSIGEVEARESGVLRLLAVEEGETVPPGTPIGIVADPEADIVDLEAQFDADEGAGTEGAGATTDPDTTGGDSETPVDNRARSDPGASADVRASPRAQRRAEEVGIDLAGVEGTGPEGAITAEDVDHAAAAAAGEEETGGANGETEAAVEEVRASPRAKDRATDLGVDLAGIEGTGPEGAITAEDVEQAAESEAEPPSSDPATDGRISTPGEPEEQKDEAAPIDRYHDTTLVTDGEAATALIEATGLADEAFDFDVSELDVLLVAVSTALAARPAFNATLENDTHHLHERQRVVLGSDTGERSATIPRVTERSFAGTVAARRDGVGNADDGPDDADDADDPDDRDHGKPATFALTIGDSAASVLEEPTVAGLAANPSRWRAIPAAEGEGVSLERYLSLSVSYDPRAVGENDARAFLETVAESIERAPELILRTYR
jgi:pyruvate dehydrogenase E2 component (dihydrolipoamide acetyltransferase)